MKTFWRAALVAACATVATPGVAAAGEDHYTAAGGDVCGGAVKWEFSPPLDPLVLWQQGSVTVTYLPNACVNAGVTIDRTQQPPNGIYPWTPAVYNRPGSESFGYAGNCAGVGISGDNVIGRVEGARVAWLIRQRSMAPYSNFSAFVEHHALAPLPSAATREGSLPDIGEVRDRILQPIDVTGVPSPSGRCAGNEIGTFVAVGPHVAGL